MPKITKTLGPIHFEDLEPHRFEDLVRQLIYDFRDWQNIEATGRSGADDGFDVRAWEKVYVDDNQDEDEGSINQQEQLDGNLWMIQCKREKEIGPTRVTKIIEESINKKNQLYGYILAAPTNFSKLAYDKFRETLRARGVQEFYLWGKANLEDMLYMPKNDRILFAFFGISLIARRKSRRTQIRFVVNNKNKLFRIFGEPHDNRDFRQSFLARDIKDKHYPWHKKYKNFKENPRWEEYIAIKYHPLGLLCNVHEYYAYIDQGKKELDYTDAVDLLYRKEDTYNRYHKQRNELKENITDYWEHLPNKNKARLIVEGLIEFESMEIIDEKGDNKFDFPHIYVDFKDKNGPFAGFWSYIVLDNQEIDIENQNYKRISFLPKEFPLPQKGIVYKDRIIELSSGIMQQIKNGNLKELLTVNNRYDFLNQRDQIACAEKGHNTEKKSIEVLYKYNVSIAEYFKKFEKHYQEYLKKEIEEEAEKKITGKDMLTVVEIKLAYNWELDHT